MLSAKWWPFCLDLNVLTLFISEPIWACLCLPSFLSVPTYPELVSAHLVFLSLITNRSAAVFVCNIIQNKDIATTSLHAII